MPKPPEADIPDVPNDPEEGLTTEESLRLMLLLTEKANRRCSALNIYEPMPMQEAFHRSKASERLVRGGNRSGKSMSAFAETARAATGQDPHKKYDNTRALLIWIIGYGEDHIGATIYRMLFKAGAFRMIRDLKTGMWRAYRPEEDHAREGESRPAPPLIPASFIKEWAWENKAKRVFSVCRLHNGTEIHAYTSKGEPKMGDPVDLIHIDEDIKYPRHVAEYQARLSDTKGRLIWSAFPHSANDALIRMSKRAEDDKDLDNPDVEEFLLTFSNNQHIPEDEKRKRLKGWNDEEKRARDRGEFTTDSVLCYPQFHLSVHGVPRTNMIDEMRHDPQFRLDVILESRQIPAHWTRYLVLDPGTSLCAILFAAVPPPDVGNFVVCYDVVYQRRSDAKRAAAEAARKMQGQAFEAFIIDERAARQTTMGLGMEVRQLYVNAFKELGLINHRSGGTGFIPGSDNIPARMMVVHDWLTIRADGTAKLRVMPETCGPMLDEFQRYKKKIMGDEVKDKPIDEHNHLMNALEYLAAFNPQYVPQEAIKKRPSAVFVAWQQFNKSKDTSDGSVHLGPARSMAQL